jgi:hypothetical protein
MDHDSGNVQPRSWRYRTPKQMGDAMRKLFISNVLVFALVTVVTGTLLATTLSSSPNVVLASR